MASNAAAVLPAGEMSKSAREFTVRNRELSSLAYQSAFPEERSCSCSILIGSHPAGKFEDFRALGALLELDISGCSKIDCKNALEVLPTMPWAAQIQKLDLSYTDVEGTIGIFFF